MSNSPVKRPTAAHAREVLAAASDLAAAGSWVADTLERGAERVRAAHRRVALPQVRERLAALPVARLRDASTGRLRLAGLSEAGFATVLDVLDAPPGALESVSGVGDVTARAIRGAAEGLGWAVSDSVQVRLGDDPLDDDETALVTATFHLADLTAAARPLRRFLSDVLPVLQRDVPYARPLTSGWRWPFTAADRKLTALSAWPRVDGVVTWASHNDVLGHVARVRDLEGTPPRTDLAWERFRRDGATFYTLLADAIGLRLDAAAVTGYLPSEIVEAINRVRLDESHLKASLRGYQSFGARFALAQRRVILGDEMGLGKTVQALAAIADLTARHERAHEPTGDARALPHVLVVSPASVLANWLREIAHHTTLPGYRLHGPGRADGQAAWLASGGVAVTTYDLLGALSLAEELPLAMLVVDEAHYVKNPETQRAQHVRAFGRRAGRVLYLTGTPLENRADEFVALVDLLEPTASVDAKALPAVATPAQFRAAVAPVYLRRNADDVLTELPELVQIDEWEQFSPYDLAEYREAVAAGNFSQMRRAAYASGDPRTSAKLARLLEIVNEARKNGRKVVVFSYFLGVLATIEASLQENGFTAIGPLTGSTPPGQRQEMVDEFTDAAGHVVLVAQVQAGGIGLNLQAASVVILAEPQVKPTMEAQAIARAHRMGQVNSVQVHRLLIEDSVDERMLEILGHKQHVFEQYARESTLADAAPQAVDITDVSLARTVIAAERSRLAAPPDGE